MSTKDIENFFDGIAPNWDSCEDHEDEEIIALLNKVSIKDGDRVLDVACGTGRITGLLHRYSNKYVKGIDISSKMIEIAKAKYEKDDWASFEVQDFCSLYDGNYDVIVIYNAFPHFLDLNALVEALCRNLREGGKFAILHSLSRAELSHHHSGKASVVSRDLESPEIEAKAFEERFEILEASESDHHFALIGKMK